ncbi:Nse4 C-terminal-domain-containing protein [Histomonas meleagridis]|uniref:Nse4 C-terminal-domain-containing protein n=1 Tax=Histomonas meleagridis TaxID=135588 RepID=UPI00355AB346|nr:Nse4 C-terminal-domain-containing protein [Histomonas meleagridis]KAH0805285.1 Nse4 C-terminal-domain-containing protein [Histomonas meleagridis]
MLTITSIAVSQAASVNLSPTSVNLANINNNILTKYAAPGGSIDFEALGEWALRKSKVVPPATSFLFGLGKFEQVRKERAKTQRAPKDVIAEIKSVDAKQMDERRSNQLLSRARKLCDKLKQKGNTPISQVITTPLSFAQTVENAFDLAHLVREGKVGIQLSSNCVLATANVDELEKSPNRRQCVLHLRQTEYKKLIESGQSQVGFIDQ